jgi:hypothetical protein
VIEIVADLDSFIELKKVMGEAWLLGLLGLRGLLLVY